MTPATARAVREPRAPHDGPAPTVMRFGAHEVFGAASVLAEHPEWGAPWTAASFAGFYAATTRRYDELRERVAADSLDVMLDAITAFAGMAEGDPSRSSTARELLRLGLPLEGLANLIGRDVNAAVALVAGPSLAVPVTAEAIAEALRSGETRSSVAERFGMSVETLRVIAKALGIPDARAGHDPTALARLDELLCAGLVPRLAVAQVQRELPDRAASLTLRVARHRCRNLVGAGQLLQRSRGRAHA
jgi:transposase-like protein